MQGASGLEAEERESAISLPKVVLGCAGLCCQRSLPEPSRRGPGRSSAVSAHDNCTGNPWRPLARCWPNSCRLEPLVANALRC